MEANFISIYYSVIATQQKLEKHFQVAFLISCYVAEA